MWLFFNTCIDFHQITPLKSPDFISHIRQLLTAGFYSGGFYFSAVEFCKFIIILSQTFSYYLCKSLKLHRFAQIFINAGFQYTFFIAGHCQGGDGNNWYASGYFVLAQPSCSASMPSMPGICISIKMISGDNARACSITCRPLRAVAVRYP